MLARESSSYSILGEVVGMSLNKLFFLVDTAFWMRSKPDVLWLVAGILGDTLVRDFSGIGVFLLSTGVLVAKFCAVFPRCAANSRFWT